MNAVRTGAIIACVSFGVTMAMACCGIIIQEEQRKRKALDAEIERITARRERLVGPASRRVAWQEDMGG